MKTSCKIKDDRCKYCGGGGEWGYGEICPECKGTGLGGKNDNRTRDKAGDEFKTATR